MNLYEPHEAYQPVIKNGIPSYQPSDDEHSPYWEWWDIEFKRCIYGFQPTGYEWIPGRLYFYLNFCKIKVSDKTGQRKIPSFPAYRDLDREYAMVLEKAKYEKKGVIMPKAREIGATVGGICMSILHEVVFFESSEVAIGTGTPDDIKASKEVLALAYSELPREMRSDLIFENADMWKFGFITHEVQADGKKTADKEVGLKTIIHFRPSFNKKINSFNSLRLSWAFLDECGLINNLKDIHIKNRASFEDNLVQFGCPIYAGTAKSFDAKDNDYEDLWENSDRNKLIRFFIPKRKAMMKYMNAKTGKIDEVAAQAEIDAMYKPYENDRIALSKIQQEYPSEPEHCWMRKSGGLLPLNVINNRIKDLKMHKTFNHKTGDIAEIMVGRLKWMNGRFGGEVEWIPDPKGMMRMYRPPREGKFKNLYVGGVDPYHKVETVETDSMGACYIFERFMGISDESNIPVFEYVDRPIHTEYECGMRFVEKDVFYNNLLKIAAYYGCKLLVEDTDPQLFAKFKEWGMSIKFLAPMPKSVVSIHTKQQNKYGINRTPGVIATQTELLSSYLNAQPEGISFIRLLEDLRGWGAKNTDEAVSFAYCLVYDSDLNYMRYLPKEDKPEGIKVGSVAGAEWTRNEEGYLVCVSDNHFFKGLGNAQNGGD